MADYKCAACGSRNPNAYVTCNRPDCFDGRDQGPIIRYERPYCPESVTHEKGSLPTWLIVMIVITWVFLLWGFFSFIVSVTGY